MRFFRTKRNAISSPFITNSRNAILKNYNVMCVPQVGRNPFWHLYYKITRDKTPFFLLATQVSKN